MTPPRSTTADRRAPTEAGRASVAVLGGGALGLTVALRLAQHGRNVEVFEREAVPGGLAAGFRPVPHMPGGGPYLDKFYHHLFRSDTAVAALVEEMGLGARLVWSRPVNAMLRVGRLWQPYSPLGLLRFVPLPPADRLRMGAVVAYLKLQRDYRRFEGTTAHEWLQRWMGRRAYQVCWEPLLRAKFGDHFAEIAMSWFWARIYCRSFALGYLQGGFQLLYDALVTEIRRRGGEVRLGQQVTAVRYDPDAPGDGRWRVGWHPSIPAIPGQAADTAAGDGNAVLSTLNLAGGAAAATETRSYAAVVSTLPTRLTMRLVPQLPATFRQRYDWGEAYGAHCLILALRQPLLPHGEYWVNVNDPGYPFLVCVEHTNYQPPEAYGGRRLVYLGNYLPMDHPLFGMPKGDVLAQFLPALRRINPRFRDDWVLDSWAFSAPYAQPIVTRDYPEHIPPFQSPLPGLWIGSMFQVYPQDRGQNYSVALANRLAEAICEDAPAAAGAAAHALGVPRSP